MKTLKFLVAGSRFRPHRYDKTGSFSVGDEVHLEAEPSNKFDPNAIKVIHKHHHLGYIPKTDNIEAKKIMDGDFKATISEFHPEKKAEERFLISIHSVN